jgi:hypothetical protein
MKYRIRCSRVEAFFMGPDERSHTKLIQANEIITFEHEPSIEEIRDELEKRLRLKYPGYLFQYRAEFKKEEVK